MLVLGIMALIGVYLIYVAFKVSEKECKVKEIEYRFVPRTFKEESENPVKVSEVFSSMFEDPTVVLGRDIGTRKLK